MSITLRRPDDAEQDPTAQAPATGSSKKGRQKLDQQEKAASKDGAGTGSGRKNPLTQPITFGRPATTPKSEDVRVGTEPRVDLLPPEVRISRRNRHTRRGFGWGVLAVALAAVVAVGGAVALNVVAQSQLLAVRAESASLLAEQQKYAGVRQVQQQVGLAEAAQRVGAATEIDWKGFLDRVAAVQPAGLTLTKLTMDSASPVAVYQQSTDPLQGPRVGTVTVEVSGPALPDVPAWVSALQKLPGVVDVVPGSVSLDEVNHSYMANVTIHVDDSLYLGRFDEKEK